MDKRRRTPEGQIRLDYREEDGEWKPIRGASGRDIPVRPGGLTVRASTDRGLKFEHTYDVPGGGVQEVDILLE